MVYIYKKVIGNKEYYYLRVSEKKGNKLVTKDLAYLGSSIEEVKKALDNLPQYKEKIRKTYKTKPDKTILAIRSISILV